AVVVSASRRPLARSGRLNLQNLAQRIQWIRLQDVPVGVLNLPRAMYDAFVPRIFGTSGVPMLEYSQDPELPSFLFDNTVPLAELENSGEQREVEDDPASLEDSITSSWV